MSYLFFIYISLLPLFIRFAVSMDLTVDANLMSTNGNSYPSLDQAITALLNGFNLIDNENTIVLKASCIGKTHHFPRLSENIASKISNESGLQIIFENAPQSIDNEDICKQLPTLELANNACIALSNLRSFAIIGLNIHFTGDTCRNIITNVASLAFSNFCFNNSEPSNSLAPGKHFSFELINTTTLLMTNGIYLYDAAKQITINHAMQAMFVNITLLALATMIDSGNSAFSIANHGSLQTTTLTVRNFQVICEPATLVMPNSIWTSDVDEVSISDMTISNCDFNGPSTKHPAIIYVGSSSTLTVQQVSLHNLTFGHSFQSMFTVVSVTDSIFVDFQLMNLFSLLKGTNTSQIVKFNDTFPNRNSPLKYSITFKNWSLINCTLAKEKSLFNGNVKAYYRLGDIIIDNFYLVDSYLNQKSYLFNLQIEDVESGTANHDMTSISVRNINVTNTTFRYAELIRVSILEPKFIAAIENTHIEITNFSLSDSHLSRSSIIHAEGVSTYISAAAVENTTFEASSNFYLSNTILSSVLITNVRVHNITLSGFSNFAAVNLTGSRLISLDHSFVSEDETVIYAETRPFVVYNCTFDLIGSYMNSYLLTSTNPMVVIQQNIFSNFNMKNSGLLEFGNYHTFLSSDSYIHKEGDSNDHFPTEMISIYPLAEKLTFQRYPELRRVYNISRAQVSQYETQNAIFFICVNENNFTDITAGNSSNMIELKNFALKNGTIALLNNNFLKITSKNRFYLIEGNNIIGGIFSKNFLSAIRFPGYAFSFTSTDSFGNLLLDSNTMSKTQKVAFYYLTTPKVCKRIMIKDNTASYVETDQNFIDFNCGEVETSLTIQGTVFKHVNQTNSKRALSPLCFFSLRQRKAPMRAIYKGRIPIFLFQDNYIYNSTIQEVQGYTQGLYISSIVFLVAIQSQARFKNNTFNLITTLPKGNIMTVSVPEIELSNCYFSNLTFGSVEGAIHALFENISISNCLFEGIQALDSDGVGVLKFTNPEPEIMLRIDIKNTTIQDNLSPYSTVLYVKDSKVALNINSCVISNNLRLGSGSLFTIWNVTGSQINIANSRISQQPTKETTYPNMKVIGVESSRANVSVYMFNVTMDVTGEANGVFVVASGEAPVAVLGEQIIYSASARSDGLYPQFGLFRGDNFNATFKNLQISNITLGEVGLFVINADANPGEWHLNIIDSKFEGMNLKDGLIIIKADNASPNALNGLSVVFENTSISNVNWQSSSNGVVRSLTSRLGRGLARGPEEIGFAIIMNNCTFTRLTGSTGLIISAIESMYDSVAFISNCQFSFIKAFGPGAILNPSIDLAPNITENALIDNTYTRNPTFKVIRNSFKHISSAYGTFLHWISESRGIFLKTEDNHFAAISCNGNGGLIFAQYPLQKHRLSTLT